MSRQTHSRIPTTSGEDFARQVFSGHIRDVAFGQISDGSNTFNLSHGEKAAVGGESDAIEGSKEQASEIPEEAPAGALGASSPSHLQTQALLCSALARLFSYPSKQQAAEFSNRESLDYLEALTQQAGMLCTISKPLLPEAQAFAEEADEIRASIIRSEFTRLFFACAAPIRLEGHCWIAPSERAEGARTLGEAAAVNAIYRQFGMQTKRGFAADNLATELDFLSRLIRFEEQSRQAGESSEASAWKQTRMDFLRQHFVPFATRVCNAIQEAQPSPMLQYQTALLLETIEYCS